ncbi:chondroitin proteoglycan-2-like [Amyelois transitella]|uniref:chondroitin proteoglycan-2-like n=1 Tax=Amyelois transitella TaxID=680683 RepID=UPI0029903D96|nr:chondroitin proteoglycan-2-like [Amyelois transitella]
MKGIGVLLLFAVTFCEGAVTSRKECSTDTQLIPHENCNQYYHCVHGLLIVRNCSANLYFNPETEKCDWPINVDCDNYEDNDADDCSSGKAEGQFLVHENCNQYYRCVHGNLIEYTCNPGLEFNFETLQCDWSHNVNCDEVTPTPDDITSVTETDIPDVEITTPTDNCEKDLEECSKEKESNEESSIENVSNKSASNENDTKEVDSNEDESQENSSEDSSIESKSSEEASKEDNSNEDTETDIEKICAGENSDGVLIPHEDCSKFYICSGGKPVVTNCPSDLLYNPDTAKCDWPKNVDCDNNKKSYLKKKLEVAVIVTVQGKKNV